MAELLFNFSATCLRRLVCVCIPFIRLKAVGNTDFIHDTENLCLLCGAVYGAVGYSRCGCCVVLHGGLCRFGNGSCDRLAFGKLVAVDICAVIELIVAGVCQCGDIYRISVIFIGNDLSAL